MAKTWNIYRYDQPTVARATVHELEYHGSWMEDEYVIVSVRSAEPVDFHYGDHLYYRGTRYDINYDANVIKKASSGSYGEGFTYDSIKLYSIAYRLKDCGFKDVVLNEVYDQANKLVYSSQGKFSFFASSVEDLADRIKANINRFFGSGNTWKVYTPDSSRSSQRNGGAGQWSNYYDTPASYGKTDLNISVEDISCYDALKMAYTEFELSFYINGQDIVIGGKPITADYDFEYGKGNGLYEIERTSDDSQRIVTKLFAYGSEKNLPLNYYANLHKKAYITGNKIQWQLIEGETLYSILTSITESQVNFTDMKNVNVTIAGVTCSATIDFRYGVTGLQPDGTGWEMDYDSPLYLRLNLNFGIKNPNAATIFNSYTNGAKIYINNGVNINTWPYVENTAESGQNYPALLSINRLMLPGFPDMSLYTWVVTPVAQGGGGGIAVDASTGKAAWKGYTAYFSKDASDPWIKSVKANTIGVREGTANFDSDEDEIYPSIEGTGYDEVDSAEQITDNGYLEGDPSTFTLTPALVSGSDGGIEWNYSEETVSISMKDGYCVGREFQVKGAEKDGETGKWTLTLERQADSSLGNRYFPYKEGDSEDLYQVKQGDKFVILGIPLPKSFVDLASKKLLEEALKHLATIDHQKYTYIPRIDEIEMQRQDDLASQSHGSIVSVHDTICAGMQMQVTDEDLGIDYSPFIDNITIKENGNNGIPTYDVVLKDEKDMTTLERIQSEVRGGRDAVINALDGVGQGEFLSRINDDTAKGFITFMKGLQVGERFVSGLLGEGGVFRKEDDGTTYVECDKLYVRMKAYFDTVEIRDYRHSSGNRIASPAGMKCIRVAWFDASGNPLEQTDGNLSSVAKFRCFFRARDGENEVRNNFVVGDQAYCHITTVETAQDSTDAKGLNMRHYWRLVIGKSSSPDTNGEHWIDLSNASSNTISGVSYAGYQSGSDVPQEQDDIVQLGNVNDATRRGAIIEFVTGADSPSYQIFQGIGDIAGATSLSTKRTRQFSTSGKNYVNLGYATGASSLHGAGHAFLEVMGDFYFGAKPASGETVGNTYIKYDSDNQQLDIKAHVTFLSPTPGGGTQETTYEEFVSAITGDIEDLQNQIDGNIESWFYDYMPVEEDEGAPVNTTPLVTRIVSGRSVPVHPYYDWFIADGGDPTTTPVTQPTSTTERLKHLGDTFYDNTSGYAFRFSNTGTAQSPTFAWVIITDSAVVKALQDASDAYDLADHKRRVFTEQPTPPYDEGDLWANATHPSEYTGDTDASQNKYHNDLLRCNTSRSSGSFDITDWELASKYTSDAKLNAFLNGYQGTLTTIQNQIDKKAETWYQGEDPSDPQSTSHWNDDDKNHVGDMWYCTVDIQGTNYKKDTTWQYVDKGSGNPRYQWKQQNIPQSVFDTIDTKKAIYTTWNAWVVDGTSILEDGDLYIPSQDHVEGSGASAVTYKANNVYKWNETANEWQKTEDQELLDFLNGYGGTLQNYVKTQVDKKAETWVSSSNPATAWYDNTQTTVYDVRDEHVGDMWLNSGKTTIANVGSMKTAIYKKNGSTYSWVVDDSIPNSVFDTIDGKKSIYVGWNDWVVNSVNRLQVRDLFIPSSDTTQGGVTYKANKVYKCTNASTPTFQEINYTDNTVVNEIITKYGQILGITATAENVGEAAGYLSAILNHPAGTTVAGGLVLTSLIAMRGTESTPLIWGGMNGAYLSDETGTSPYRYKGHGIAAWYGGAMKDYERLTSTQKNNGWATERWAKTLFRFDGSGYVAGGNLTWDKDGNVTIQGYQIKVGNYDVATMNDLSGYLLRSAGSEQALTGTLYSQTILPNTDNTYNLGGTSKYWKYLYTNRIYLASGVYLEYNSTSGSQGVHLVGAGFYSDSFVSAFGIGTSGGGTLSLCAPLNNINNNILSNPTANGATFVWNGSTSKFVYSNANGQKLYVGSGGLEIGNSGNLTVSGSATVTGNVTVIGGGFVKSGSSNDYVLLAGGGTKLLSEIGGGGDENVKINETVPSSGTWYYPVWYTAKSGTGNLNANDGLEYYSAKGTTSSVGHSILRLGNNTVSGNDNNSRGTVRIYGTGSYYGQFRDNPDDNNATNLTANRTYYMPNKTGTLALISDLSDYLPLAGGTMTGGITMDAVSTAMFNDKGILFGTSGTYGRLSARTNGNVALCAGDGGAVYITPNSSSTIDTSGRLIVGASTFTYGGNTIWHSGNFTPSDYVPTTSTRSIVVGDANYNFYSPSNTALNLDSVYGRVSNYTSINASSENIVDLNNITTPGDYSQATNSSVQNYILNAPVRLAFRLNVMESAVTTRKKQRFSIYNSQDIYERVSNADGSFANSTWYLVQSNLANYVTTSALNTTLADYALSTNVYSKTDVNGFTWWGASLSNGAVSGDMTNVGDITLSKGAGNRQLSINKSGAVSIAASTSGWSSSYNAKTNDGSSNLGAYGFFGSGDTLTRMYIGTSYTGTWISILPSGNVGIGVDSPTSKLHVDGTFNATGNSTIGGTLGVTGATSLSSTLTVAGTTTLQDHVYIGNNKYIYLNDSGGSSKAILGLTDSNNIRFGYDMRTATSGTYIYAGTSGFNVRVNGTTTNLLVDSSGNVSIGSTTASFITEKLNVNGNIRTKSGDGAYIQIGGARIVWDNTNNALKVIQSDNSTAANLYATGAVSAFGIGSSASGLSLCTPLNNINTNILSNPTVDGATFVWNGNTSKFVYSSASGQTLRAYTMYVDVGGLTVGNSGNLTVGGAATVTGAMTVENGNIVVTSGSAAIGTTVSNSYKLRVNGATFMKELYLSSSTSSSPTNRLRLYYNSGFYLSTGSTDITYRNLTVTVGTASPYIDKSWIVTSDMRLKTIVSNAGASIEQIADAPIFNYKTQDGGSDVMLGTSAQYWQTIFPCAVKDAPNGYLAQDYPATALAAAVITARKVVDHEQRIRQLEIENEELKKELKQLKTA